MTVAVAPLLCSGCGARRPPAEMWRVAGSGYRCEACRDGRGTPVVPPPPQGGENLPTPARPTVPESFRERSGRTAEMATSGLTMRQVVRLWADERLADLRAADVESLVFEGVEHFSSDEEFTARLIGEMVPKLVRAEVRRAVRDAGRIRVGSSAMTADEVDARAAAFNAKHLRWQTWVEQAGERRIPLMAMTKRDLLAAASWRERASAAHLGYAALWRALAERLDEGQRVSERFRSGEIESLYAGLVARMGGKAS